MAVAEPSEPSVELRTDAVLELDAARRATEPKPRRTRAPEPAIQIPTGKRDLNSRQPATLVLTISEFVHRNKIRGAEPATIQDFVTAACRNELRRQGLTEEDIFGKGVAGPAKN